MGRFKSEVNKKSYIPDGCKVIVWCFQPLFAIIYYFCLNDEGAIVSHGFIKTKKYHVIIIFVYRLLYDPV